MTTKEIPESPGNRKFFYDRNENEELAELADVKRFTDKVLDLIEAGKAVDNEGRKEVKITQDSGTETLVTYNPDRKHVYTVPISNSEADTALFSLQNLDQEIRSFPDGIFNNADFPPGDYEVHSGLYTKHRLKKELESPEDVWSIGEEDFILELYVYEQVQKITERETISTVASHRSANKNDVNNALIALSIA